MNWDNEKTNYEKQKERETPKPLRSECSDLLATVFYKKLECCTCDDDPYSDACDWCLAKRGVSGYFPKSKVIILKQET